MFNQPMKSHVHEALEIGSKRGVLTDEQRKSLDRMDLGYRGEMDFFNRLADGLSIKPIPLYNLQMKIDGSECQIDCLLIFQHELMIFEVKNYQGDFFMEHNKWYTMSKNEIRNPLHQLQRTELLLQQFLTAHKSPLKVNSSLVFTNPSFFLYQPPLQIPIIFPNQLTRSIQKLQNIPCAIREQHYDLANMLKAHHRPISSFESRPTFAYDSLKKGVICKHCDGFMGVYRTNYMRCGKCEQTEDLSHAIMRTVREYHLLFPNEKLKTKTILDWTNNSISPYRIRKIVGQYAKLIHKGKESYYQFYDEAWMTTFK